MVITEPNYAKVIGRGSELWCVWVCKHHGQFGVCWAPIRLNEFSSDSCYRNWQQISNPQKWIIYIFWYVTLHYILSRCISSQADIISHNMMWHDDRHQKCFLLFWGFLRFHVYPKCFWVVSRKIEYIRWMSGLHVPPAATALPLPCIVFNQTALFCNFMKTRQCNFAYVL